MTSPRPRLRTTAFVLIAMLAVTWSILLAPRTQAGTAVVIGEDFESGAWDPQWSAADNNPTSGLDFWGVTNYRAHTGNYSAWSAQVGTQAVGGQNNTAVRRYDNDMQADLVVDLRVNGFTSLTLSFYYWSRAESGGGDFIQAWYEAGGSPFSIFTNTGNANWDLASVAVPTNVDRLIIRFQTDGANNNFEGGYVDDIVLTGTESVPPTSNVDPLPLYSNAVPTLIPYSAQDNANASGVAYVELWWRAAPTGAFTLYTRPANPLGRWLVSPISFDPGFAAGDSYYEFYTVAVDNAANVEAAAAGPDASITVDTTAPTISITAPSGGAWLNVASTTVTWQGSDALSGLDHYEAAIDGLPPSSEGLAVAKAYAGLTQGNHQVEVTAYDVANNVASALVAFGVDTVAPVVTITTPSSGKVLHLDDVLFRWSATDATSGIARYEVWIDGASHRTTSATELTIEGLADGTHVFHVLAFDNAGNSAQKQVTFRVATSPWSWDGPYGPFPLIAVILAILAALFMIFFLWKRRRDEEEEPAETPEEEPGTDTEADTVSEADANPETGMQSDPDEDDSLEL